MRSRSRGRRKESLSQADRRVGSKVDNERATRQRLATRFKYKNCLEHSLYRMREKKSRLLQNPTLRNGQPLPWFPTCLPACVRRTGTHTLGSRVQDLLEGAPLGDAVAHLAAVPDLAVLRGQDELLEPAWSGESGSTDIRDILLWFLRLLGRSECF